MRRTSFIVSAVGIGIETQAQCGNAKEGSRESKSLDKTEERHFYFFGRDGRIALFLRQLCKWMGLALDLIYLFLHAGSGVLV